MRSRPARAALIPYPLVPRGTTRISGSRTAAL